MKIGLVGQTTWTLQGLVAGGAERQLMLLADAFSRRGHDVACIVPGWSCARRHVCGVELIPAWKEVGAWKGLRWVTSYLPQLRRQVTGLGADVLLCRGFSLFAPSVVAAAHASHALSLVGLASDSDLAHFRGAGRFESRLGRWSNGRLASWYFCRYALKAANFVVAQTRQQQRSCQTLGIQAALIPSIVEPWEETDTSIQGAPGGDVVWVGALSRWKGIPELDATVAAMPEISFEIVGPVVDPSLSPVVERVLSRPNVHWLGELNPKRVIERMRAAKLLLNTSPQEGFPNAMLEAWSVGRPVLSLVVNPDNLLTGDERLGECAGGAIRALVQAIRDWSADSSKRACAGARAIEYIRRTHAPSVVCEAYENLLERS